MVFVRQFIRARKGAAVTEFAFSSIILIFVLMLTLEFGVEVFLRQQAERAAGEAAVTYALTRSPEVAQDAANGVMLRGFRDCLQPMDIILHNNTASLKNGSGREAQGGPADDGATIAKVTLACHWPRLTPVPRIVFGPKMTHEASSYVRLR